MKQFNKELLQGNYIAVHCKTPEQAQQFVGWVCSLEEDRTKCPFWEIYKEDTCYTLDYDLSWGFESIKYFKEEGYDIIPFEEALI